MSNLLPLASRPSSLKVYCGLSLAMAGLAMVHLQDLTPWVDEVMFMDTPMHYTKGMGWTTYAWYAVARQEPFSLYPPMYTMLMTLWMKVVGTSLVACRSLNLVFMLAIGWGLLRICRQTGVRLSLIQTCLLVVLLWRTEDMIFMYSNGRPDLLSATVLIFTTSEMIRLAKGNGSGWSIVTLSAILLATGIQATVCLCILLLSAYLSFWTYRDCIKRLSLLAVCGTLLGFTLVCSFMAWHHHLTGFVVNAVSYSATLMKLAAVVLPIIGDHTGFDVTPYMEKIVGNATSVPLYMRILTIFMHPAYIVLLGTTGLAAALASSQNRVVVKYLFTLVWAMPVFMNLAGRFPSYYYWMAYLPLFLLTVIMAGIGNHWRHFVIGLGTLFVVTQGLIHPAQQQHYQETKAFLAECTMLRDKNVVAPFSAFYALEQLGGRGYYLGVYPIHCFPHHIDYVILPQREAEYGVDRLYDYWEGINRSDSLVTITVAKSEAAGLTVFKVISKEVRNPLSHQP